MDYCNTLYRPATADVVILSSQAWKQSFFGFLNVSSCVVQQSKVSVKSTGTPDLFKKS